MGFFVIDFFVFDFGNFCICFYYIFLYYFYFIFVFMLWMGVVNVYKNEFDMLCKYINVKMGVNFGKNGKIGSECVLLMVTIEYFYEMEKYDEQ